MVADRPKAFVSWSSGKDSAFALLEAERSGLADIAGVLTIVNDSFDRVAMHGVRRDLLAQQVAALGLPCIEVPLPYPCPNNEYETRMADAVERIKALGVRHIVFGDLFLEDIRDYRENQLTIAGMHGLFPLWKRNTRLLAHEMIASGLVAHLVCVDPRRLNPSFAGRRFDAGLLRDLPADVDPCGENGEFHTVVSAGPMFRSSIKVSAGERLERDGFIFSDFMLTGTSAQDRT